MVCQSRTPPAKSLHVWSVALETSRLLPLNGGDRRLTESVIAPSADRVHSPSPPVLHGGRGNSSSSKPSGFGLRGTHGNIILGYVLVEVGASVGVPTGFVVGLTVVGGGMATMGLLVGAPGAIGLGAGVSGSGLVFDSSLGLGVDKGVSSTDEGVVGVVVTAIGLGVGVSGVGLVVDSSVVLGLVVVVPSTDKGGVGAGVATKGVGATMDGSRF